MFVRDVPQQKRWSLKVDRRRVHMPDHVAKKLADTKPHLWVVGGRWYCGPPFSLIVHAGAGATPMAAYDLWLLKAKTRSGRRSGK